MRKLTIPNTCISEESLLNKLATTLFVETSSNTSTNNRTIYFSELEEMYSLMPNTILELKEKIVDRAEQLFDECIASIETGTNYFDITLYDNFCEGYIQDDLSLEDAE